jgi:teichuronic acid biosynthesis glycosyltransferase TuaC
LRILAISDIFPHENDPTSGIFAARQFLEMAKQGAQVTVLVPYMYIPHWTKRFKKYSLSVSPRKMIEYDSLSVISVCFFRSPGKWMLLWDGFAAYLASKSKVYAAHKANPFDIIYCRGFWRETDIGLRLSKRMKVPVVGVGIGTDVNVLPEYSDKHYRYFSRIANSLQCTLATGKGVAEKIESVSNRPTRIIGGVVDVETFSPVPDKTLVRKELGLPYDKYVILFVGHILKAKGIYELINAFVDLKRKYPQIILRLCGNGIEFNDLSTYIMKTNVADIKLVGNIAPGRMSKWMQAADMFVLPSYREGMPNVVMEAMSCGLPIIATAVGGLPDAIGDCQGAFLIEPRNVKQLSEAMGKVIADASLQNCMKVAARKTAEEKFAITKNVTYLLQIMQEVIDGYVS